MGGLKESTGSLTFVNIKEGNLVVKQQDGTLKAYRQLGGCIKKISFSIEEYEGRKYEKAKILIDNVGEGYLLQMRTDSGYFRGFCNSLKSSTNPKGELEISPSYKKQDGKNPQTTCFVSQNGKALKHAFTKDNMGDLPALKTTEFKGETHYDNTDQINYWKKWLLEIFNDDSTSSTPMDASNITEPIDDLPF
jgi:hypothetical protein